MNSQKWKCKIKEWEWDNKKYGEWSSNKTTVCENFSQCKSKKSLTLTTPMDNKSSNALYVRKNSMLIMTYKNFKWYKNAGICVVKFVSESMLKTNFYLLQVFLYALKSSVKIKYHNTKLNKFLVLNLKLCKIKSWVD